MNNRKARKKFKKKHGMNPEQYAEMMENAMREAMKDFPAIVEESMMQIKIAFNTMAQISQEAMAQIASNTMACEKRTYEMSQWFEILANANRMPEYTDKDRLENLGKKTDPFGIEYNLYKDNANKTYFIDFGGDEDE